MSQVQQELTTTGRSQYAAHTIQGCFYKQHAVHGFPMKYNMPDASLAVCVLTQTAAEPHLAGSCWLPPSTRHQQWPFQARSWQWGPPQTGGSHWRTCSSRQGAKACAEMECNGLAVMKDANFD
jgi:hypothetical protein